MMIACIIACDVLESEGQCQSITLCVSTVYGLQPTRYSVLVACYLLLVTRCCFVSLVLEDKEAGRVPV